ncbi:NAD(P)/FAD-dependent oxidoreductase [Microbacterium sp. ASV49]|uniref:FAD-dependent oxidoreductase n=1 Tax=Microbacterium candidum TaxID=3041922 RepID=A0ABT7N3F3_9MICO|nr:FAD-dependent oxidoreductase [Microbacterium sp. ASV49]MDL9981234.1 FAD-dependent oxidoreductase [Microbacterium sp. ASV49]
MTESVVVIGSGIAGASTFFALARRGARVTLVDAGDPGQATAASAGIIQPWSSSSTGAFYELYAAGAAYYPELLSQLAETGVTRTDFRRPGGLVVSHDAAVLDEIEERLEARRAGAADAMGRVERMRGARARELFPPLAEHLDAVFIEGGARVDGRTLRDALIEAGTRLGGTVHAGRASVDGTGVAIDGEPASADAVVVAAGAWTRDLLGDFGRSAQVTPQRGQITHLRIAGVDTSTWPSVTPLAHNYLVAFDDGRLAVGATRESGVGFDPRVTAAGQLQVLQDALAIAPGLADATVIETRVGLRPLADDGVPIVGAVPGRAGMFVATGYGAAGLTMGPLLGDALSRAIAGEDVPLLAPVAPPDPSAAL